MSPDELLYVLSSLESKGSGWGMSYYNTRCPRKARLDRELGSGTSSYEAQVGVVFHKLEELYYSNQLGNITLPLSDDPEDCKHDPVQEALRCFQQYIKIFPKDEFTTISCEQYFPATDVERFTVEAALNVEPFTGRIDRVVHINEEQARKTGAVRGLDLAEGYYLVDTKTTEKRASDALFKYDLAQQFTAYMVAWNAMFGATMPVSGLIVNNVIRHQDLTKKDPDGSWRSFRSFLISYPSQVKIDSLRAWLPRQKLRLLSDQCDLTACTDWGGCNHYKVGNCNRI